MNQRIKELAEQAGIYFYKQSVLDKHYPELYDGVYCESSVEQLAKFAELIVKECISIVDKRKDAAIDADWHVDEAMSNAVWDIEEHFGVE